MIQMTTAIEVLNEIMVVRTISTIQVTRIASIEFLVTVAVTRSAITM